MLLHRDLTDGILGAFYSVYRGLRYGYPEAFYRRAIVRELRDRNFNVAIEAPFKVVYKDEIVGRFKLDLLIDDLVVVELKAARAIVLEHREQLYSYLKASHRPVGLLLNFGPVPSFKRMIGPGWTRSD